MLGLRAKQLETVHDLGRFSNVHSLFSHQLLRNVVSQQVCQMISSQLVRLTSQHLNNPYFCAANSVNSDCEPSIPEICNSNDLAFFPFLPIFLIRNSNAMVGADKAKMLDPSCLDTSAERQSITIDFPFKNGSNHLDYFLSEQVLEMRIGVIDALDDKYHWQLWMEFLYGCFMIHFQQDVPIAALLEAVVVVLAHCLKGFVLVLDRQQKRNIRETDVGWFFIDVDVALLKKQRVVHHDGLAGEIDPDEAVTQIKPYDLLPLTLFHYQSCIYIQPHQMPPIDKSHPMHQQSQSCLSSIQHIIFQQVHMRLQFQLNKIKIDPVCHIQILRHAEQFQQHTNIYGQLYGALLDDEAEVTSVMALPDGEKSTKEELQAMEKRNDEQLGTFNLDSEKIGWYLVCYSRNFWDSLETIKYYENYINTSFFLVFDFKNRLQGKNPYRAFRLKDEFALKQNFKWQDLQKTDLDTDNPFEQIPVEVQKNELFELMMLFNKNAFLRDFSNTRKKQINSYENIKQNIEEYLTAFEEREEVQKYLNENYLKNTENTAKPEESKERIIPYNDYCQYIGQALKLDSYEKHFKQYLADNQHYQRLFQGSYN